MAKKVKELSYKNLVKELDRVFSLFIRNRDKHCICCGSTEHLQAGHYITRANKTLRWNETNVNAQCRTCNVFKKGNYPVYALKMLEKYGNHILEKLDLESKVITKYSKDRLKQMIVYYKKLINE